MDAAEDDGVGLHLRGGAGQLQAVAGEVGQFLDVAFLVVVGQDGGVFLGFEVTDFVEEIGHQRVPFRRLHFIVCAAVHLQQVLLCALHKLNCNFLIYFPLTNQVASFIYTARIKCMEKLEDEIWWRDEFRPANDLPGIDHVSRDGKTVVKIDRHPQGMRGVYAGIMRLSLFVAQEPSVRRACFIINAAGLSRDRLLNEWQNIKRVLTNDLANRLALVAIGKEETWVDPPDQDMLRIARALGSARTSPRRCRGGAKPSSVRLADRISRP